MTSKYEELTDTHMQIRSTEIVEVFVPETVFILEYVCMCMKKEAWMAGWMGGCMT